MEVAVILGILCIEVAVKGVRILLAGLLNRVWILSGFVVL